ncbi:oocyte zinc finger protein XlCOF26-like [Phlebotomus argentipes]|uniref:oocyte zinc finger protein XlCOF26-like n=1 Tax=Phlebotomus argentipes TaxID=94469 RepID=UPI0028936313|nr:oocyte zinc finger protein XlCOF26-like [Phlebotomus argentipes]
MGDPLVTMPLEACRGCLKPEKSHFLFGSDELSEKFRYCTQLKIEKGDGLSTFLCKLCYSHLQVAYNFKRMCKETNTVLKKLLHTLSQEKPTEVTAAADAPEEEVAEEYPADPEAEEVGEVEVETTEEEKSPKRKYDSNRLQCSQCRKKFSCPQALKLHTENTHGGVKRFSCDICSMRFTQKHSLQSHMMRHTNERPFQCHICQRGFRRKQILQMHLNCHTGETPYRCDKCQLAFRTTTALRNHGHNLSCPVCDKAFQMIPSLQKHIQRHKLSGDSWPRLKLKVEHICDECGKSYACKSVLEAHKVMHTGLKPHKCDQCDKAFPLFASLKVHIRNKHPQRPKAPKEANL